MASYQTQTAIVALVQLSQIVLWIKKMQFAMSEIKAKKYDSYECHSFILHLKFPTDFRVYIITFESMGTVCVLRNSLLASHKICDQSPDKNMTAK